MDSERETYNAMLLEIDAWRAAATKLVKCFVEDDSVLMVVAVMAEDLIAMVES